MGSTDGFVITHIQWTHEAKKSVYFPYPDSRWLQGQRSLFQCREAIGRTTQYQHYVSFRHKSKTKINTLLLFLIHILCKLYR